MSSDLIIFCARSCRHLLCQIQRHV